MLYYKPKSKLGLAVFLRGTGMVFHRKVLEDIPWESKALAEDTEYTFDLIRERIDIKFLDQIKVSSNFPTTLKQLSIQRHRWAEGNLNYGKKSAFKIMWQGIKEHNLKLFDAGWSFIVLSKPIVLFLMIFSFILSILFNLYSDDLYSLILLVVSAFTIVTHFIYYIAGIFLMGITLHRLILLVKVPFVVLELFIISIQGFKSKKTSVWTKTPRETSF
jgi:cellulose synthase/poly-beta-1,6-N-acetylglucosamine synthase-like glycosyltransferase